MRYRFVAFALILTALTPMAQAATLHVGAGTVSITPDAPIAVSGQMHTRIARTVESPVEANVLALETRNGDQVEEQAIFVACGLVAIREGILEKTRAAVADRLDDFDVNKLVLSATHTHTGPVLVDGKYRITDDDVMMPPEYVDFFITQVSGAIVDAWKARKPAQVGWGMDHAVVAYNRRSYFEDGHHQMYGDLAVDGFRGIEGPEDHAVEVLYFWDTSDTLIATAINVACPAQEVESRSAVNADFWHPVREGLKQKHGENLVVLGWIGAAGDQSPHIRYRQKAEDRMRKLRGLSRLDEIARRIIHAWEVAYEGAQQEKHSDLPLRHEIRTIELPERIVTDKEAEDTRAEIARLSKDPKNSRRVGWHQRALDYYDRQQGGDIRPYIMELHTLRLGDVAIATNDFELFTQFGIQMKAKSPALHTFLIQLAGPGSYVPTPFAAKGGGYSAVVQSTKVGPEGGQVLVDETVKSVKALWE